MASITKHISPGSKVTKYRAHIRRTGQVSISKLFTTKKEAELWARDIESLQDKGSKHDHRGARETSVGSLFERFRDEVAPTRKGAKWEIVRVNRLLRTARFMKRRLDQIKPLDIRDWRDERLTEVSAASVSREMKLISSVFTKSIKLWDAPLLVNPCFNVEKPANSDNARNRRPSLAEIEQITKACGLQEGLPPKVSIEYAGWAFLLAIETAMRISEIATVKVGACHPNDRYIQLVDTKNGDNRAVPLSKRAAEIVVLLSTGKKADEDLIPVTPETLGMAFAKVCKQLKIIDLHFHDSRHEATTRLSKKLVNVLELSAVTGHKTLSNLKRYYNPTPQELAAKLD